MNQNQRYDSARIGGYALIAGALLMVTGAAFYFSTGIDLWDSLSNDTMAAYLAGAGPMRQRLIINLTLWIVGVLSLGVGGVQMADICQRRRALAQAGRVCFLTAIPLAIIAFIAMMALVVQIAPDTSDTAVALAKVVGWIGARADDLATALIVGFGPLLIALAGRDEWVPRWLLIGGWVAAAVALISLVGIYLPGLADLGFLIVPVGLVWMLSAGVQLLKSTARFG